MIKKISTKNMSRDEWLEARRIGIGGSDAGALFGKKINPYSSPTKVWLDKTGRSEPWEGNLKTRHGQHDEDFVAKEFERETGKKVRRRNAILVNDKYPFAMANIDREVVGEKALLECKITSYYDVNDFRENPAETCKSYYIQCMHYLAVTGMERIYLAMLFYGYHSEEFAFAVIERSEAEIEKLMKVEEDFWNSYVLTDTMPPADGSEATEKAYKVMFKDSDPSLPPADVEDMLADLDRLAEIKEAKKELDREQRTIEENVKQVMGATEKAECSNWNISWKVQKRTTLDTDRIKMEDPEIYKLYGKETESRVFRVTKKKQTRRKRNG